MTDKPTWPVARERDEHGHCRHHDCQCIRAAELASQDQLLEAIEIHQQDLKVPCRHCPEKP